MLVCLISGFRRGFARTLIGTLGWLVALVAAFFAADPVRNIVKEQTEIYDSIYAKKCVNRIIDRISNRRCAIISGYRRMGEVKCE